MSRLYVEVPKYTKGCVYQASKPAPSAPNRVDQWLNYNHVYLDIEKNPHLRAHMANDPGYKWMRKGWMYVGIAVLLLAAIGLMLK